MFAKDFAPDEKFLYQRKDDKIPARMIRGYQIKGEWLERWGNIVTAAVLLVIGALVLFGAI